MILPRGRLGLAAIQEIPIYWSGMTKEWKCVEKFWVYHGEWSPSGSPSAKTWYHDTMIHPRLFHTLSQWAVCSVHSSVCSKSKYILPCKSSDQHRQILDVCSVKWFFFKMHYIHVVCSVQCSMCRMKCINLCPEKCILSQILVACWEMCSEQLICFQISSNSMSFGSWNPSFYRYRLILGFIFNSPICHYYFYRPLLGLNKIISEKNCQLVY